MAMDKLTIDDILKATGGTYVGDDEGASFFATQIKTDTRAIKDGDVFLALRGARFDGHDFIDNAIDGGARLIICECPFGGNHILVADTLKALGDIAAYHRARISAKIVALTGSSGKTSTKQMLGAILSMAGETLITQGNLNNDIGAPLTLLNLKPNHRYGVIELGANHIGEIAYTANLAQPDVACVLNVGSAHIGEFGGREQIARAKAEIFVDSARVVVIPDDDDFSVYLAKAAGSARIIRIGKDIWASDIVIDTQTQFCLHLADGTKLAIKMAFLGRHHVQNALFAAACALSLGVDYAHIQAGLLAAKNTGGRLKIHQHGAHTLIDDSYNANLESVLAATDVLMGFDNDRRILVLGDIGELGAHTAQIYTQLNAHLSRLSIDVLALGKNAPRLKCARAYDDLDALMTDLRQMMDTPCAVLVKGSRFMQMERVIMALMDN